MMLRDKVVLVSGVGAGLGRSIALRCAEEGADVAVAARTSSTLDGVAKEIRELGRRALAVPADIGEPQDGQRLAETVLGEFGRLDVLVNNAFAMPPMHNLSEMDPDRLRTGFEVTVLGTLRLTQQCTPALVDNHGSVVMVNSMIVRRRDPEPFGGYRMTKSALLSMAQNLATELGPRGVRVNSVAPGRVWDDRARWYYGVLGEQRGLSADEIYAEYAANNDLRRLPEPESVANAVVFLGSELASSITGHCLDVNCGEHHV